MSGCSNGLVDIRMGRPGKSLLGPKTLSSARNYDGWSEPSQCRHVPFRGTSVKYSDDSSALSFPFLSLESSTKTLSPGKCFLS
jgi:hypothetical protein